METVSSSTAVAPPRLAPTGVLSQGQGVIKPIACRPVVSSANTTPILGQRLQQPTSSTTSPNSLNNNRAGGLYCSASDLRSIQQPQPPASNGNGNKLSQHLQRFSWSKSHHHHQHSNEPPPPPPATAQPRAPMNSLPTHNGVGGRVADLSRRFGGSLSSVAVAAPPATASPIQQPAQPRQPPAYRPPPSSSSSSRAPVKGRETFSSSELHLDRTSFSCARPVTGSTPSWALGGSEVNLSSLSRSTLPRHHHQETGEVKGLGGGLNRGGLLLSAYEPLNHHHHYNSVTNGILNSCNGSRSSWAGLPSTASVSTNSNHSNTNHKISHHNNNNNVVNGSLAGSTSTLSNSFDRRDDAATPIVEEGRIRSIMLPDSSSLIRARKHSAGSLDEDFDCCDGPDSSAVDGTPSPSDSGVVELEVLLKEKDCEIALLRETLEQNEAVIFQVYQEKEKSWERELKKLRSIYEERMRAAQQMASQAERQLQTQQQQWQAERKQLKQQIQQLKSQCEQVQGRLDETSWTLCQKSGEMALVKSQLKDAQSDQSQRCQELAKLKAQLKESQEVTKQMDRRSVTSPVLSMSRKLAFNGSNASIIDQSDSLKVELQRIQRRLVDQQQSFDAERQVWHEEKATVLVYQRHLQQQYVQAMKRNQQLEEALGLLGITGVPHNKQPQHQQQQQQKTPSMSSPKSNCSDPITIDLDSSSNSSSSGETHC